MIGVERLEHILKVIAVSGEVTNGVGRISVTLIGPSGSGRSQLIFRNLPPNCRVLTDFTGASLINVLIEKDAPTWIVCPDLNVPLSHRGQVSTLTMSLLIPLLAEGIQEIPALEGPAKVKALQLKDRGVTIGLITALTSSMFRERRGRWRHTGLLRRLLPIYFDYSAATASAIQRSIQKGGDGLDYTQENTAPSRLKPGPIKIPSRFAGDIRSLSDSIIGTQMQWTSGDKDGVQRSTKAVEHPFTLHKTFRGYARASARMNRRSSVTRADIDALIDLSHFVRYDHPEEI